MGRELITKKVRVKNKEFQYKYLQTKEAVVILPVLPDGRIVLIKQHRIPVEQDVFELPAGGIEKLEKPDKAALRELEEETGYKPEKLQFLTRFYSSPGITNEVLHLFLANINHQGDQKLDDIEEIEVFLFDIDEAIRMIENHKITDAKTIIGILWFKSFLQERL